MVKREHAVQKDGGRSSPDLEGWEIILLVLGCRISLIQEKY